MEKEVQKQKKDFRKLMARVEKLSIERRARSGSNTLDRPGPGMVDKLVKMGEGSKLTENALKNAHLKVECSREQLRASQGRLEDALKKINETQKAKLEVDRELEKYNFQTNELPQVLKTI